MLVREEQLKNKDFLAKTKNIVEDVMGEDRFREAYDLSKILEKSIKEAKDFKERNYDLYRQYGRMIIKLKWVGLPVMVERDIVDMFKYHLKGIFFIPDYDIFSKLEIVLLGIVVFKDRDKFKEKLRQALIDNQEKITNKRIVIDKQEEDPTIGKWIQNYNRTLGTGGVDNIKRIQYLTNSENIKNLTEEEKNRVRTLFDLYEKLKLSSLTLEGLEEEIPVDEGDIRGVIKQGVFEPMKEVKEQKIAEEIFKEGEGGGETRGDKAEKEKSGLGELYNMLSQYPAGSLERKAVEEELRKLSAKG